MIDDSPPLPKGWRWSPLADACPQRARNVDPCQFNEEFDYVDISAVDLNLKEITGARRLRPEQAPSRARQLIEAGDILVSGTRPNLNAVALVPSHLHHSICSTGFSVLRPGSEVDGNFLFSWVQTQRFVQSLTSLTQGLVYPAVTEAIVSETAISGSAYLRAAPHRRRAQRASRCAYGGPSEGGRMRWRCRTIVECRARRSSWSGIAHLHPRRMLDGDQGGRWTGMGALPRVGRNQGRRGSRQGAGWKDPGKIQTRSGGNDLL